VNKIGVLLWRMSGIAADLVRQSVARHDDIEIVDAVMTADDLRGGATLDEVDVVITMLRRDRSDATHLDRLLVAKPGLCALAIQYEGRTAVMYTLVPHTTPLGTLTPDTLIDFIRALPRLHRSGTAR